MRAVAASVVALAGVVVPAGAVATPRLNPVPPIILKPAATLKAAAAPSLSGAQPVALRLAMRTELRCGSVGGGPVLVVLPRAEQVPSSIAAAAVRVNGAAPTGVAVTGHAVSLTLTPPGSAVCDVIGPGTVVVVFAKAAGLGNPAKPGTYRVSLRVGSKAAVAPLIVKPG